MIASVAVQDLLELAGVSLAATIGLSLAAAVCVLGVTRATELRRAATAGRGGYAALALAGALVVAGACVAGSAMIVTADARRRRPGRRPGRPQGRAPGTRRSRPPARQAGGVQAAHGSARRCSTGSSGSRRAASPNAHVPVAASHRTTPRPHTSAGGSDVAARGLLGRQVAPGPEARRHRGRRDGRC